MTERKRTITSKQFNVARNLASGERHWWADAFSEEITESVLLSTIFEVAHATPPHPSTRQVYCPTKEGDRVVHRTSDGVQWSILPNGTVYFSLWHDIQHRIMLLVVESAPDDGWQPVQLIELTDSEKVTEDQLQRLKALVFALPLPNCPFTTYVEGWHLLQEEVINQQRKKMRDSLELLRGQLCNYLGKEGRMLEGCLECALYYIEEAKL